jgi:hypothetical protein
MNRWHSLCWLLVCAGHIFNGVLGIWFCYFTYCSTHNNTEILLLHCLTLINGRVVHLTDKTTVLPDKNDNWWNKQTKVLLLHSWFSWSTFTFWLAGSFSFSNSIAQSLKGSFISQAIWMQVEHGFLSWLVLVVRHWECDVVRGTISKNVG